MKYILFILFVFIIQGVVSQENSSVRFGLKAGTNFSHINFSKGSSPADIPINTNWQPGIVGGFVIVIPVFENIYFQPEYLFSQMGGKIEEEKRMYQLYYLSLPASLRWNFFDEFSLLAGPQFDLLIKAKEKSGNDESSLDDDIEHRSIFITGGLEYYFSKHLVIGMKYMQGFNHIDTKRDDGNKEFKYDGFQFYISYLF